jgi:predicted SAM-dependent methyltransferase
MRWDVTAGTPCACRQFHLIYHSRSIDHLVLSDVARSLAECQRGLKPGGVIRIATPDLERIRHTGDVVKPDSLFMEATKTS